MPRPTLQIVSGRSPRSYLATTSYDTRNLPNPFQDTPLLSSTTSPITTNLKTTATTPSITATAVTIPIASDTIASTTPFLSSSSSSFPPSLLSKSISANVPETSPTLYLGNSQNGLFDTALASTGEREYLTDQKQHTSSQQRNSEHQGEDEDEDEDKEGNGHDKLRRDQDQPHEQIQDEENPLVHLTAGQREAAVENLEIETMDRIQKLRASIGVLANSLRFRSEAEINRLPAAVRTMTVEEYWFKYNVYLSSWEINLGKTLDISTTTRTLLEPLINHNRQETVDN